VLRYSLHNSSFSCPHTSQKPLHCCSRAQASNASAVLVSAVEGNDVVPMNCQGKQCKLALHTFASMIPYAAAKVDLLSTGSGFGV